MTDINAVARRVQYTGNNPADAGPFSFTFQVNATTEVNVFVDGTLKTLSTHYTVSLSSSGAGSVSFTSGNFPTNSQTITISSNVGLARSSVYTTGGPLTAAALEKDFDTQQMILQQVSQKVDRALAAPENDATSIDMELPVKADRLGKILGFNSTSGNPEMFSYVTTAASDALAGITAGTVAASKFLQVDANRDLSTIRNVTSDGTITAASFVIGSAAINENDLEALDDVIAGTVAASKAAIVDTNKDITGFRNITLTGELDAATLDISGDADIDGTLEADAITIGGVTLAETIADTVGAMVSSNTESGIAVTYDDSDNTLDFTVASITAVGALDSGSITSNFGTIDTGSSTITTTGEVGVGRLNLSSAVSVSDLGSDAAQVGYSSTDGLLLMGQGSSNDVVLLNDTGTIVCRIPTGLSQFVVSGSFQVSSSVGGKAYLTTSEQTVVADDSLGALEWYAPSETSGTDSIGKSGAIECVAEGEFTATANPTKMEFKLGVSEAATAKMTLASNGNLTVTGDLTITGDDLFMNTNTSGYMLVADGTNYNPVAISGDVTMAASGAVTIASDAVESGMLNDNVISGQTELASGIADTDEILISDAGTIKRTDMSVVKTYAAGSSASKGFAVAMAIAL